MVEMLVPAIVTRTAVDVDAAVVASIVEGLRPIPLTRPVITAPLAEPLLRVGPVGPKDADDSPQAVQAINERIAARSLKRR